MKDNADNDAAPFHSCKKRKLMSIEQGIAAPWKWDAAVPFRFVINGGPSVVQIDRGGELRQVGF